MKLSTWWVSTVLWLSLAAGAAAQPKQVVVLPFEGKGAAGIRQHVVAVLSAKDEVTLVPFDDAKRAAAERGQPLESSESFVAVAQQLGVDAFVEGDVRRARGRWVARVRVRDASTGEVVKEEPWARRKRGQLRAIRGNFWPILGPAIMDSSAPKPEPEPEPEPVAAPEPTPQPAPPEPQFEPREPREPTGRPALTVDILPGLMWRTLEYNDATANLRSYHNELSAPAFLLGLETAWYPGAHFTDSRWADLGVEVGFDYAVGLESNDPATGNTVGTTAWDVLAGAVFRIPVDVFTPKLKVGYVHQVFATEVDPDVVLLPDFAYSALRFGAGLAFTVTDWLELEAGLAYLHVLDAGQVNSDRYFPRGTAGGIDLDSSAIFYINDWFGLMLGIDWRRYGHDFRADPTFEQVGGEKLAGGAVDRFIKLDFGARFRL